MTKNQQFQKVISNNYLDKSKLIKASTEWELKLKIDEQLEKWKSIEKKEISKFNDEQNIKKAKYKTENARAIIKDYQNILVSSLGNSFEVNFESIKKREKFRGFNYPKEEICLKDIYSEIKVPEKSLLEYIFSSLKEKRICMEKEAKNILEERRSISNKKYNEVLAKYNLEKLIFEENQKKYNENIDKWERNLENGEKVATESYLTEILKKSKYPKGIIKNFLVEFNEIEKTAIIVYKLPNPDNIPKIIEYKYIKTRREIDIKEMKKTEFEKFYDDIVFQITLKTIYDIFNAKEKNAIEKIVFNGWVDYIDVATGRDESACLITIKVDKNEFKNINFNRIEYKPCIKRLKGIFAGKLVTLIPVKPILNLSREDKRFVDGKDILSEISNKTNLAAMHWEDFEHLVGQLFEKKFTGEDSEVRITQSSRDGGVDAVIFDSDPLKGGKFIIQAKRYNNVVPVSDVRDLYGTVIHEHAVRGILVTTSSYGNDSYEFIKEKPITLIGGAELLAMFNELGYSNLRIELRK